VTVSELALFKLQKIRRKIAGYMTGDRVQGVRIGGGGGVVRCGALQNQVLNH
jgi:hypothetical protein